jgi:hypothetical protein
VSTNFLLGLDFEIFNDFDSMIGFKHISVNCSDRLEQKPNFYVPQTISFFSVTFLEEILQNQTKKWWVICLRHTFLVASQVQVKFIRLQTQMILQWRKTV